MDNELKKCADSMARKIDSLLQCQLKEISLHLEMLRMIKEDYQMLSAEKAKIIPREEPLTMSIIPQT